MNNSFIEQPANRVPLWIIIVSSLLALLGLSISISMYVMPVNSFIPTLDPANAGVHYLNSMCAARQLAIAACLAVAVIRRSPAMLTLSWLCYLLLNIQDALIGLGQNDTGMIAGGAVISVLAIIIMIRLNRK